MEFSLTTLGTGSAHPNPIRFSSAHAVKLRGHLFLIDCGEGCQINLCKAGLSIVKIEAIFISHLHGDHCFGIFGLLSTMALLGRTAPLKLFAPPMMGKFLNFFQDYFSAGVKYEIEFTPLVEKEPLQLINHRTFTISAFPLDHQIETYGFLFKEKEPLRNVIKSKIAEQALSLKEIAALKQGKNLKRENGDLLLNSEYTYLPFNARSFAYCSDTAPFERLPQWIDGVDLLYHEATYADDNLALAQLYHHSTARQAAEIATAAHASKLVLGHYSSRYKDLSTLLDEARSVFEQTFLAKDGMVFDIPIVKNIG